MEMVFTNSRGSIRMAGGGSGAPYKIRAVDGLGYIGQSAEVAEYPLKSGQRTLSRTPVARVITVSIDGEAGRRGDGELGRIAHDSGRLSIVDGSKSVYADCYISAFSSETVYGKDYGRYTVQFTCDYPYFRDSAASFSPLFQREKLIVGSFSLPAVFSKRAVGSVITVSGDMDVYPRMSVGKLSSEDDFSLSIFNESTGNELKLNLPSGNYAQISFDLRSGSISCGGEDFTKYLDGDSYMSDFLLRRGENTLRITAAGIDAASASVSFENEYISAWEEK